MIFTNTADYGGSLIDTISTRIKTSNSVNIASGYVSYDIISKFEPDILKIAKDGGLVRILIGMAFYEGLAKRTLTQLRKIETKLNQFGGQNGIYVCFTRRLHCKIYCFSNEKTSPVIYVGSSNFSRSGLKRTWSAQLVLMMNQTKLISFLIWIIFSLRRMPYQF